MENEKTVIFLSGIGLMEKKAAEYLFELKKNQRTGKVPVPLRKNEKQPKKKTKKQKKKVAEGLTFHDLFDAYIEQVKIDATLKTYKTRLGIYRNQISDDIKQKTLSEINVQAIEAVKLRMIAIIEILLPLLLILSPIFTRP